MKVERVSSGIPGLDKLIEGGFVKGSTNLVAGGTGTGKTIFGCQFLLEGLEKGESVLYVTLEQRIEDILDDVSVFGWDEKFRKYLDAKKFTIVTQFPSSIAELKTIVYDLLEKNMAKRFVLDSLSVATLGWKETEREIGRIRRDLFDFLTAMKKSDVTSLLISEIPEDEEKKLSRFGIEEFLADSVVKLNYLGVGGAQFSTLEIRKMRRTDHERGIFQMEFSKAGLKIITEKGKPKFQ